MILDQYRSKAATCISAPAGSGKTTLAATYISENKLPHLWYQLDKDDSDPATFFYYLGIATRQLINNKSLFLPLLTPEYLSDIPGFTRRYFRILRQLLPDGSIFVLDNYQDLGDTSTFADILRGAIEEISGQIRFLILSRQTPTGIPADTADVAIIGWDMVRLTLAETQEIIAQSHNLDINMINALHCRADGWPAGVILLVELLTRGGEEIDPINVSSMDTVFDYFTNELLKYLPASTQDFLEPISKLPSDQNRL